MGGGSPIGPCFVSDEKVGKHGGESPFGPAFASEEHEAGEGWLMSRSSVLNEEGNPGKGAFFLRRRSLSRRKMTVTPPQGWTNLYKNTKVERPICIKKTRFQQKRGRSQKCNADVKSVRLLSERRQAPLQIGGDLFV
eukprot:GEMP01122269.1.p1 GENE.GEMP01122269.1~~GEMP01122269.1.p1  ORF type:complete len:137 (-),score=1.60 GEMP01122269.1:40-450(-)